ncbi:MAG: carboxy terminal-processing peptidase [Spirochaetota bacterium]
MKISLKKNLLFYCILFITFFGCFKQSESLNSNQVNSVTQAMLAKHVNQNTYNDTISERTLSNLFKITDPFKMYYLQSDIEKLERHRSKLDNYAAEKNYEFLDELFSVYLKRFSEQMRLFDRLIKNDYDFTVDESMITDPDAISYAKDEKELEERWRKRIKFQLLNFLKTDIPIDKAKKKLIKRYELVRKETQKYDDKKQKSLYLKAFAMALDPHTAYMTPQEYEDFKMSMELKLTGIGAVLRSEDGFVYVDSIIPGGPASELPRSRELKPNDKIIAVAQGDGEPEDVIDIPLRDAVDKIRGKEGTTVRLTILRKDPKTKKEKMNIIPIERDRVVLEQQAAKKAVHTVRKNDRKLKIGYLELPSFYMDYEAYYNKDPDAKMASRDIFNALEEFKRQKIDALVFDLRNNPGGALHESTKIAGYFIKFGPVLMVKAHDDVKTHFDYDPAMYYDGPVVVLVNSSSASASEIFAGAIQDYKRGILIGTGRTFGKGTVQDLNDLGKEGGAIKVTIQLFYQPSGKSNNKDGIVPDITVPSYSSLLEFHESELDYALDWQAIKKSDFNDFGKTYVTNEIIQTLQRESDKRRKGDDDFQELSKQIAEAKAEESAKKVSLLLDENGGEHTATDEETIPEADDDKVYDLENDIFLREAFAITGDYIVQLSGKQDE